MRDKRYIRILGLFQIALAIGAILVGISMITAKGLFANYPKEWIGKIPFDSWSSIGILGIVVFGIGNLIAAIAAFSRGRARPWIMSVFMGGLLFVTILYFRYAIGEWYLATFQFLILSIIQIVACIIVIYQNK